MSNSSVAAHLAIRHFTMELPRQIDQDLAGDIEKQSVFVAPDLLRLTVAADRRSVTVHHAPDAAPDAMRDKAGRYLEAMLARFRKIEAALHFENRRRDDGPLAHDVYGGLRQRGWLHEHGPGQVSLAGPALRLMQALDRRLASLYREAFDAEDRMFPAMISAEVLARCGYFESHPNAVSFVTHLVEDFDEIERFRLANAEAPQLTIPNPSSVAPPHICLNPAACFPCYEAFERRRLARPLHALTWTGRVFRYESRNVAGLDRLWEFNVRELVLLGDEAAVAPARQRAGELMAELLAELDLDARIETATDPFFATVYAAKTFWQQTMSVKQEIKLTVEPAADGTPRSVAAGSINYHGAFFGSRFEITSSDGEPAASACLGCGLERWLLALFTQHGFEAGRWPESLRAEVFE